MNPVRVAIAVARKDLRSEWRTRELVPALAQFVVLALVIANFGFQIDSRNAPSIAPGVLWLTLVFAGLVLAAVQRRPEFAIGRAVFFGLFDEHAVMLALDFAESVADRLEEVLVGADDGAVHVEFDHGLRFADR